MPAGASDRIIFEGRRTTRRTAAMLTEARRLTGLRLQISQGGYNAGGVAASAGTHDRDALDLSTSRYSASQCAKIETALWKVGFAAWWRRYIFNVWPQHHHCVPKGGDISRGAANQVSAFKNKRDGLAGSRPYPRIGGYTHRTWESYLRQRDGSKLKIAGKYYPDVPYVSVKYFSKAWVSGRFSRHTYIVQRWLRRRKFYNGPLDGLAGPQTKAAYTAFRRSLGWSGSDATGLPGLSSLSKLRDAAKSPRKVA